ncbi:MAG: radical SAM protein [Methanothrix sp.]|nr:radical SAM protein [Methanothrix sp.]
MKVNLGGIVPLSTVDWLGRASMVVFLRGCPLRCPHCHNRELQAGKSLVEFHQVASRIVSQIKGEMRAGKTSDSLPEQIDLDEASERARSKPFVDALVLSGGEPLLQSEPSARLFRLARSLDLATGLETSGCYPDRMEELLKRNLVDKVFLDLKAALHEPDYERATAMKGMAALVLESLRICMASGVPLDVRTTIFPEMPSPSEVFEIAETLSLLKAQFPGHRLECLVLQQGRPREGDSRFEPVSLEILRKMAKSVEALVKVQIRAETNPIWKK